MRTIGLISILTVLIVAVGCSGASQVSQTGINAGEKALRSNCIGCHSIPTPGEFDDAGWKKLLDEHSGMFTISEENYNLILNYVQENNDR